MRSQFIPVVTIKTRSSIYQLADWLNSSYINRIPNLELQAQYVLQAQDVPFPELISFKNYGTTDFWWVLLMYNGVIDPIAEMQAGIVWGIPSYASIQNMLSSSSVGAASTNQIGTIVQL